MSLSNHNTNLNTFNDEDETKNQSTNQINLNLKKSRLTKYATIDIEPLILSADTKAKPYNPTKVTLAPKGPTPTNTVKVKALKQLMSSISLDDNVDKQAQILSRQEDAQARAKHNSQLKLFITLSHNEEVLSSLRNNINNNAKIKQASDDSYSNNNTLTNSKK